MTSAEIQQQLDSQKVVFLPVGHHPLDVPLFLDSDTALIGPSRQECFLDAYWAGTGIIAGWRRGLITDDHLPSNAFRTFGDVHLFSRGTELDLGPFGKGWGSLGGLRVEYSGMTHGADWLAHNPNEAFEVVLAGIQEAGVGYGPFPSPWLLWWDNRGNLTLSLRFADGVIEHYVLPASAGDANLSVDVSVDFGTGSAAGTINGKSVAFVTPRKRLAENFDHPFQVGKGDGRCNAQGYWGQSQIDVTVNLVRVSYGNWTAQTSFNGGRLQTYPGGPSLPLVQAWSSGGTRFLHMVHKSQGVLDACGNTTVRGVTIGCGASFPGVTIGSSQGALRFDDVAGTGGTRFVQCSGLAVAYPLSLHDIYARGQQDRQLWLWMCGGLSVMNADFGYGVRGTATLHGCVGAMTDVFVAPPSPAQDAVFDQQGGSMAYERVIADYEYSPSPSAVVRVTPRSYENATTPTKARLQDCDGGTCPLTVVLPRVGGNSGVCRVEVDEQPVFLSMN